MAELAPPKGLDGIVAVFGDIDDYLGENGEPTSQWEDGVMQYVTLPFPITDHSNPDEKITRLKCHHKLKDIFFKVFSAIKERKLEDKVIDSDGCYCFRKKSSGTGELSVHSWGIAIDLNVGTNKAQTVGDMAPELIAVFQEFGFEWGGNWHHYKDPMHFQYCTGY